MPNYYQVEVNKEHRVSSVCSVIVETMKDLDDTERVGEELEEIILDEITEMEGNIDWMIDDEDVDAEYEVLGRIKKLKEIPENTDGRLKVFWGTDDDLEKMKNEIAEKDKEIAELKKQLEKK